MSGAGAVNHLGAGYRLFREHFGDLDNLAWMGRTKGAPIP